MERQRVSEERSAGRDELVEELRSQIEYLREENRRKDHLLAAALERIPPQLEAPSESAKASETPAVPDPSGTGPPEPDSEALPWWRRLFGG
jgi:hypothetical protein